MRDDATWSDLWWRIQLLVRVWARDVWHPIKVRLRARRILKLAKQDVVYWYSYGERRGMPISSSSEYSLQHGAYLKRVRAERKEYDTQAGRMRSTGEVYLSMMNAGVVGKGVPIRIADLEDHDEPTSPPFVPRPDPPSPMTVREAIESIHESDLYRHNDGRDTVRRAVTFRGIPIEELDLDSPAARPRRIAKSSDAR